MNTTQQTEFAVVAYYFKSGNEYEIYRSTLGLARIIRDRAQLLLTDEETKLWKYIIVRPTERNNNQ